MSKYENVLFDLDGTLLDTAPGILRCLRHAFAALDLREPDEETLRRFIGPSLMYSFTEFTHLDPSVAERAIEAYRAEYLAGGMYECTFYDGIVPLLNRLFHDGVKLSVATSKPRIAAEQILDKLGILPLFACVSAPDLAVTDNDKTQTVRAALLGGRAVMVGDRKFDILAAKENGIDSIGVTYGFAPPGEFEQYAPDFVAKDADQLTQLLF